MKRLACLFTIVYLFSSYTNAETGINFIKLKNWDQVLQKAKAENKHIFVDAFATWCAPCKKMDKEVFPDKSVGDFVNANFIAVKVQIDTTNNDDERTKNWYRDAHAISQQYQVTAFPSFLFLSPKGEIVHKGVGYKNVQQFISLCEDALNPEKQYFTLINNYEEGEKNYSIMSNLASTAKALGDKEAARKVSKDYIENYLSHRKVNELTRDDIAFITQFTGKTKDGGFSLLYNNADAINSILEKPDFVQSWVCYFIAMEEIQPVFDAAMKDSTLFPDWNGLRLAITQKYNGYYADRTILQSKSRWYGRKKDWMNFTMNNVALVVKYGAYMNNDDLNKHGWNIFLYSNDKKEVESAAQWMIRAVKTETDSGNGLPANMDTYANLLYKLGKKDEAIKMQTRAVDMITAHRGGGRLERDMKASLEKMKKGEPTWVVSLKK